MNNASVEFEKKLAERNKPKSKLEEDSFIDWDMICSFIISAILHSVLLFICWNLLLIYFEDSYNITTSNIRKNVHKDLVFRLLPGKPKTGEMTYNDLIKSFKTPENKKKF